MPRRLKAQPGNTISEFGQVNTELIVASCSSPNKSVTNTNRISVMSNASARSQLEIAKIEEKYCKKELELKLALMQAQKKVELAALRSVECSRSVSEHSGSQCDRHSMVGEYLRDCENHTPQASNIDPVVDKCLAQPCNALAPIMNSLELPKVELAFFDGDPIQYWKFVRQFETYVESKIAEDGQRLLYLLYYCKGSAREAIDECIMLPPSSAYKRARSILERLFGQKFYVARSLIDRLLLDVKSVVDTTENLSRLAVKMQNCGIALKQMDYEADVNATVVLEQIVKGLPKQLQYKWAEYADRIYTMGREPLFEDLTEFISDRARVSSSRFGQLAQNSSHTHRRQDSSVTDNRKNVARPDTSWRPNNRTFVVNSIPDNRLQCLLCQAAHTLAHCPGFHGISIHDRWNTVRRLGVCFVCLKPSHRAAACQLKSRCSEHNCKRRHHPLLHTSEAGTPDVNPVTKIGVCNASQSAQKHIRLGVLPVYVETASGMVSTYAFLDSGSDTTLVKRRFVEEHGIKTTPSLITIASLNGEQTSHECLKLKLFSLSKDQSVEIDLAYTVDDLPVGPVTSVRNEAEQWAHLKEVPFDELTNGEVTILIGCDVPEAHWAVEQIISGRKQPYAVKTLLGWVLCGPLHNGYKPKGFINCLCSEPFALVDQIQAMYNLEFGDSTSPNQCRSVEDERAWGIVSNGTQLNDGHYVIPLPWKQTPVTLPNNKLIAEKRLHQLRRRLLKDKSLLEKYQRVIEHHINKGFLARSIEPFNSELCWYLPHHPVFNVKKPDKLRVVFDCAAKFQGVSLNDCLLQGPDLTSKLIDVLMKFRMDCVAVAADIEEMFLQVNVPKDDQRALRVLWWDDGDLDSEPIEYKMTVHPFGAISSPFCANYALQNTVSDFGHMFDEHVRHAVGTNFYVDDYLASFPNAETAKAHVHQLTTLLSKTGFRLTKWVSNKRDVLRSIPLEERAPKVREFTSSTLPTERALGICWNAETDEFIVSFHLPDKPPTRRGVLSAISSLYDPLGFVSPWLLPGKILLQELCRKQLGWDEPLNADDLRKWNEWVCDMRRLGELRLSRCLRYENCGSTVLDFHIFCDASEVGYGAVVYGCFNNATGFRYSTLILSKARVAPLKAVSIPRLELAAAVLAVRLWQIVEVSFGSQYQSVTFWTDSMIVLHYINNVSSRFSTFVSNRLSIIHDATKPNQWRHVNSGDNPADLVSRGSRGIESSLWWLNGPLYLSKPIQDWPVSSSVIDHVEGVELKRIALHINSYSDPNPLNRLCNRYSDWHRLLKATAWLTRFKQYLTILHSRKRDLTLMTGSITQKEMQMAEVDIIRIVQSQYMPTKEQLASDPKSRGRSRICKGSSLYRLQPLLVDGLLRVGGRLSHAMIDFSAKHPIILPRKHDVTNMIIRHYHNSEGHAGVAHVLAAIRQRYWIVNGTTAVKCVIGRCMFCRRQNAVIGKQLMSPLPIVRVQAGWHPFSHAGVDYFGPIEVKRGRSLEKRYGCIFTCMQSRAIHLEMANSLTTDSFIMALMRFVGRRGAPSNLYSDNGSNFIGAERELNRWVENLNQDKISKETLVKGIQWHFNPPYASHRGGVWERLIRSVRRVLRAVCGEQTPDDELLTTVLVEVERILNNRPIVPLVSNDPHSMALTPNNLLLLRDNSGLEFKETYFERYTSRWKRANYMATVFWKRWTKEYLPTLHLRQKWINKERNFVIGDIVLVDVDGSPRNTWPLGIITACYPSLDGLVRTVDVKTISGIIKRDIRRVCLLEGDIKASNPEGTSDYGSCTLNERQVEPRPAEAAVNLEATADGDDRRILSHHAK